jgi:glutamate 5-kinase
VKQRIVVKLGSNVVLNRGGQFRTRQLDSLARDLAALHRAGHDVILVTSGGIARGARARGLTRPKRKEDLQAAGALGQASVYQTFEQLFARRRIRTAQVLFTFAEITELHHFRNVQRALARLVAWRAIPVINENDTTTMDDITFENNDYLAAQVANMLRASRLVLLTNVDGVFTSNPSIDPGAELIPEIIDVKRALRDYRIQKVAATLGTGGMYSKVVAAEMAVAGGTHVTIANGLDAAATAAAVRGEAVGTVFPPRTDLHANVSPRRDWIRSRQSKGALYVDDGAARALLRRGASLLPVGVTRVVGGFERDAIVDVMHGEEPLGKGIVSYAATELESALGLKTAAVRKLVADAPPEAIHRDNFVRA